MEISTIVAGLAFIVGIAGWLKASQTRGLLKKTNQEMESLRSHVTASGNILERKIEDLGIVIRKRPAATGQAQQRFHMDMTVAEALALHPQAATVMAQFHLGGCSSCSISESHILGPAAESYGVDITRLLTALNNLLEGGSIPEKQPRPEGLLAIEPNA